MQRARRLAALAGAVVAGANLTDMLVALTLKQTGPSGQA